MKTFITAKQLVVTLHFHMFLRDYFSHFHTFCNSHPPHPTGSLWSNKDLNWCYSFSLLLFDANCCPVSCENEARPSCARVLLYLVSCTVQILPNAWNTTFPVNSSIQCCILKCLCSLHEIGPVTWKNRNAISCLSDIMGWCEKHVYFQEYFISEYMLIKTLITNVKSWVKQAWLFVIY